ncbi:MAG: cation:proton antiporter [Phycisphaerae bacterium]|nr:cation:proton antiporter [Phycisphaerae bacterium]
MNDIAGIIAAANSEPGQLNLILLLGLAVLGGTLGARLFQRFRIPQVVGYIVIGILVGGSVFNLVTPEMVKRLEPFTMFALGLIGFLIGGELQYDLFKRYGRQFITILLAEGLFAFALVTVLTTVVAGLLLGDWPAAAALGIVLGAISSATAPAATVDVLWEYKTRGPLTRTVLAIVALDDGLALLLFGFAVSVAQVLTGEAGRNLLTNILLPVWDIAGAILIGVVAGLGLVFTVRRVSEHDKILTFTLASVSLIIGLSIALKVDSILAAMALGATIGNGLPRKSHSTFELVEKFTPPIYVLFFVLVGARLELRNMPMWVLAVAVVYVLGRTGGKIAGVRLGARISHAPETIRKYLGYCLFSQAGVAVGLSILAGQRFTGPLGDAIILVVTATTFLVQIVGPPFVKYGVRKAGEIGLNVTEDDLVRTYKVADVYDTVPVPILAETPLREILRTFATTTSFFYPVLRPDGKLLGAITTDGVRSTFEDTEVNDWLIALDIMEPVLATTTRDAPLAEAQRQFDDLDLLDLPVVDAEDHYHGVLNARRLRRKINTALLEKQRQADALHAKA